MKTLSHLLRVTVETARLDIGWLYYFWGAQPDYWHRVFGHLYRRHGIFWDLAKHTVKIGRSVRDRWTVKRAGAPDAEILFFVDSLNQWRAVTPIQAVTRHSALWIDGKFEGALFFPADAARFVSLFFLPLVFWKALSPKSSVRFWTIPYALSGYLDAFGYYFVGAWELWRRKPRALVLSNDHGPQPRALLLAARRLGIPTYYVQHAPVTSDFPPLEFDHAILDGLHALESYSFKNPDCRVHLAGMARRKDARFRTAPHDRLRIGIAFNDFDSEETIDALVADLASALPEAEFFVRPHPADWRRFDIFRKAAARHGFHYDDPEKQSSWDFMLSLDLLVGGNSGIMLEAAFLGVIPLHYHTLLQGYDHYGYQKAGVVRAVSDARQIREIALDRERVRGELAFALNRFDVTFGTPLDGQAAALAARVIEQALPAERGIPPLNEQRIDSLSKPYSIVHA